MTAVLPERTTAGSAPATAADADAGSALATATDAGSAPAVDCRAPAATAPAGPGGTTGRPDACDCAACAACAAGAPDACTCTACAAGTGAADLLARLAAAPGARTAVVAGDRSLTFEELRTEAAAIAARLTALGAGPESVVALCLP
ncbi:AMP-binding protein, partial [Streptomyces zhihengii]|uniref:AMP-binding protein n=1 Tax=Streptomyces zhihengii TaxID=1818004 RepID=UPI0033BA27B0